MALHLLLQRKESASLKASYVRILEHTNSSDCCGNNDIYWHRDSGTEELGNQAFCSVILQMIKLRP